MFKSLRRCLALGAFLALSSVANAQTYTIDFDTDAAGNPIPDLTLISNQYEAWGAFFAPDIFTGFINPLTGFPFASNTDVIATSTDVGFGYEPALGNILHSFGGWLNEDGDPNILLIFDRPAANLSMDIVGDFSGSSQIFTFDTDGFQNGYAVATELDGLERISVNIREMGFALVVPGYFFDWAGVDNITYTLVPEPGTFALLGGLALPGAGLLLRRRRNRRA